MKWKIDLIVAGSVFSEYVIAENRPDAITTAKARNPKAKIINSNPIFS